MCPGLGQRVLDGISEGSGDETILDLGSGLDPGTGTGKDAEKGRVELRAETGGRATSQEPRSWMRQEGPPLEALEGGL